MEPNLINIIGEMNYKKINWITKSYKYSIYLAFLITFISFGCILLTNFENKLVYIIGVISMLSIFIYTFIAKIYINKGYLKFVLTPMIQNIYTDGELNKLSFTEDDYINSGLACYKKHAFDNRQYHNYTSISGKNRNMNINICEILITKKTIPNSDYYHRDDDVVEKCIIVKYDISNIKNKAILTNDTINNILSNNGYYNTMFNITEKELFLKIIFPSTQDIIFSTSSAKNIEKSSEIMFHYDLLNFIKSISDEILKLDFISID